MASVLHATPSEEVMGRLTERRVEQAMEMKRRETSFARGVIQKKLRLVAGSQKITGTAETAKCFVIHQRQRSVRLRHGVIVLTKITEKKQQENCEKTLSFSSPLPPRCATFHLICIRGHT